MHGVRPDGRSTRSLSAARNRNVRTAGVVAALSGRPDLYPRTAQAASPAVDLRHRTAYRRSCMRGGFSAFVARLWGGFGVPQYELVGVRQLGDHVLRRTNRLSRIEGDPVLYGDWVASEFTYPLRALLWGSARARRAHMLLNLLVVGGGFATSGIAVAAGSGHRGTATSWIVFAIGLLVALVGGANQLFRPGFRANERRSIAVELREEGWTFAMGKGEYAGDDTAAFDLFQRRVSALQRRVANIGALETEALKPPQRQRGRSTAPRTGPAPGISDPNR